MKKAVRKWEYRSAYIGINLPEGTDLETLFPGHEEENMVTGAKMRYWQECLEEELNKLGAEGWELISIYPSDICGGYCEDAYALLKRPLDD